MHIAKQYFLDVLLFPVLVNDWVLNRPIYKKANQSALLDFYVFKKAITLPAP